MAKGSKVGSMYVELTLDGQQYQAKLKKTKGDTAAAGKQMEKSFGGVSRSIKAAGAALGTYFTGRAVVAGIKSITAAFMEQEKAVKRLESSLATTGRYTRAASKGFQEFASAIQKQTVYGDEAILQVTALIAQLTKLDNDGLKKATKAAVGLSAVFGSDLQSSATLVAKALAGNYGALSRYGIAVEKTMSDEQKRISILEQLNVMYKRAQADTETFAGKSQQLTNIWGDLKEVMGEGVAATLDAVGAFEKLNALIENQINALDRMKQARVGNVISDIEDLRKEIRDLEKDKAGKSTINNFATGFLSGLTGTTIAPEVENTQLLVEKRKQLLDLEQRLEKMQGRKYGAAFPKPSGVPAPPPAGTSAPTITMADAYPLTGLVQFGESLNKASLNVSLFGDKTETAAQKLGGGYLSGAYATGTPAGTPKQEGSWFVDSIDAFGKAIGINTGKEFWSNFKDEWKQNKVGAIGNVASSLMGVFQAGQGAPSTGYAGVSGGVQGAVGGAGVAASLGAGVGATALMGGAGAVVGAGLAIYGASEQKSKEAREKRRAREAEARQYQGQLDELSAGGFMSAFGSSIGGGVIKKSKKELEDYLNRLKKLSEQITQTFSTAFQDIFSSSTAGEATEKFGETLAKSMTGYVASKAGETIETLFKQIVAPVYQLIDDAIAYLERKIGELTKGLRNTVNDIYKQVSKPLDRTVDAIAQSIGKGPTAALLAAIYTAMPAITAMVSDIFVSLGKVTTRALEPAIEMVFKTVQRMEKLFGVEPEWIKEMNKAGLELADNMGKDLVDGMKDAWSSLKDTITGALEDGFNSYTVSSGWRNFQTAMKEGIYKFILSGLSTALIGGGLFLGALAPVLKDFVVLFKKAVTDGFDVDMFSDLITDVLGNVNDGLAEIAPLFAAIFPEVERLRQGLVGSGATNTGITAADAGSVPQAPEEQTPIIRALFEALQRGAGNIVLQLNASWDALKEKMREIFSGVELPKLDWDWPVMSALATALAAWQFPVLELVAAAMAAWDFAILNILAGALNAWKFPILEALTGALNAWSFPIISRFVTALESWKFPIISGLSTALNNFVTIIKNLIQWVTGLLNRPSVGGIDRTHGGHIQSAPGYASGTPYVPQDGFAYLHRGEAIIPAADNRKKSGAVINNVFNISGGDPRRIAQEIGFQLEAQMRGAY